MKAMVLAAGLGTRLRPLTDDRPKALVEIGGHTLLEITLTRLRSFGISEAIINLHHFADMVVTYLQKNHNFGMRIEISREDVLLDTGGGLKKAAWFFLDSSKANDEPFVLHNVDVVSSIHLARMIQFHLSHGALATLAVQDRETSRHLLFDEQGRLCGRQSGPDDTAEVVTGCARPQSLGFSGIQVIAPRFLTMMTEQGTFSIIASYLRLAALGEKILAFKADEYYWRDVGKPESLAQIEQDARRQVVRL